MLPKHDPHLKETNKSKQPPTLYRITHLLENKKHVHPSFYPQESNTGSILTCKNQFGRWKDDCCTTWNNVIAVIFHTLPVKDTCALFCSVRDTSEPASTSVKPEGWGEGRKEMEQSSVLSLPLPFWSICTFLSQSSVCERYWRVYLQYTMRVNNFLQLNH